MKSKKIKRVFITALAALCAMSSMAAITASAKTEKYVHKVAIATGNGETAATWMTMSKKGTCSDLFANYPTIFDGKKISVSKSRIEDSKCNPISKYKTITLQKNSSSPVSVNYGTVTSGQRHLYYKYVSGGGFSDTVTTIKRY